MCELNLCRLVHITWSWCEGEFLNCWRNTAADCGCPNCQSSIATCSVRICTLVQWSTWRNGKTSAWLVALCVFVVQSKCKCHICVFSRFINWTGNNIVLYLTENAHLCSETSLCCFLWPFVGWEAFHHPPFWPSYLPSSASKTFPASFVDTRHLKHHPLPSSISAVNPEANSNTLFSFYGSCRVESENSFCPFSAQLCYFSPPDLIC